MKGHHTDYEINVIYYWAEKKTTVVQAKIEIWKGKELQKQADTDESLQTSLAFTSLVLPEAIPTNPVSNFLTLLSADNQEFHNK